MKHQEVSVDYWSMGKVMATYLFLTVMGWVMLRLFNMVFLLPERMRNQSQNIQRTLEDLQRRFPNLGITEDDIINAEKNFEELEKEVEEERRAKAEKEQLKLTESAENNESTVPEQTEDKKNI